ncbi:MAG: hypothetical protein HY236_14045 [Acidobacteria bacterium]|nr:hypothetical protein [Acidobacteriota bacterium]
MILITQPQRRRALLAGVMVCLCGMAASTAPAATVAGNVVLINSKDRAVNKERDYSGVVVWLEPWNGAPQPPAGRPLRATMLQKNKTFIPHVLAVEVGTAVDFRFFQL